MRQDEDEDEGEDEDDGRHVSCASRAVSVGRRRL